MQELPIGVQDFEKIRRNNYLYIDKTEKILELAKTEKSYFLSRPRRFGKSLILSTLDAMFKGKAELFKGLCADEWVKEQAKHPNPVIKLDMSLLSQYKDAEELNRSIINYFVRYYIEEYKLDVVLQNKSADVFLDVINKLYKNFGSVVVLIDEYDKPITDNISNLEKANEMRETLRSFYGVLKGCSQVKFLMITGVSKFSKAGVFSSLNNLEDISMDEEYSDIVGYTQEELEKYFFDWFEKPMKKNLLNREDLIAKIKDYYYGFSFDGIVRVYNPFSVLNFFKQGYFDNYWYDSAMPSFLAKYLKEHTIKDPKVYIQKRVSFDFISTHEIENTSIESFLYQTGYLTIKARKENVFILDYPNEEVLTSMNKSFLDNCCNIQRDIKFSNHKEEINDLQVVNQNESEIFSSSPFKNANVGDCVKFGSYPQTANGDIQPIEWQVLAKEGNKILVISKYGLDISCFDVSSNNWKNSAIHQWANNDFYNKAFNENEKKYIKSFDEDNVFLLSQEEAKTNFANDESRKCKATEYVMNLLSQEEAKTNEQMMNKGVYFGATYRWWWLPSPNPCDCTRIYSVRNSGFIHYDFLIKSPKGMFRPALWINI